MEAIKDYWYLFVVAIMVGLIIGMGLMFVLYRKNRKIKKGEHKSSQSGSEEIESDVQSTPQSELRNEVVSCGGASLSGINTETGSREPQVDEALDRMISGWNSLSAEQKCERIKGKIDIEEKLNRELEESKSKVRSFEEEIKEIRSSLGIEDNANILDSIKKLKESSARTEADADVSNMEETKPEKNEDSFRMSEAICKSLNEYDKDNLLKKVFDDAESNGDVAPQEILNKFVEGVVKEISDLRKAANEPEEEKFRSLLNKIKYRNELRIWLCEKIKDWGITVGANAKWEDIDKILRELNRKAKEAEAKADSAKTQPNADTPLTDEQKNEVVRELVTLINEEIADEERKLNSGDMTDFVVAISEVCNREVVVTEFTAAAESETDTAAEAEPEKPAAEAVSTAEHTDKVETAKNEERLSIWNRIKSVFGYDESESEELNRLDIESLRKILDRAIRTYLANHIEGFEADSVADADKKLKKLGDNLKALKDLMHKYQIKDVNKLDEGVRCFVKNQEFENIKKDCDIPSVLPDFAGSTTHKLVNQLIKRVKVVQKELQDAKKSNESVEDELIDKIKSIGGSTDDIAKRDIAALLDIYNELVMKLEQQKNNEIAAQKKMIADKEGEISGLGEEIKKKDSEIEAQKNKTAEVEQKMGQQVADLEKERDGASRELCETLHSGAKKIKEALYPLVDPCEDDLSDQAEDVEKQLHSGIESVVSQLEVYNATEGSTPVETRKDIQDKLIAILQKEDSVVNKLCRYYVYSRLPLMEAGGRKFGMRFKKKNITRLFKEMEKLYGFFGINFTMPDLFVDKYDEERFRSENQLGDLDNFMPRSVTEAQAMYTDEFTAPTPLIIDMSEVGYSVDGKEVRKADVKVL